MSAIIQRTCKDCGADISFESIDARAGYEPGKCWDNFLQRCDDCIATLKAAERERARIQMIKGFGIPPEMEDPWDQSRAGCSEKVKGRVLAWRPDGYKRGIWISGDESGLGKTRLSCMLGVEIALDESVRVRFVSFPQIAWELAAYRSDQRLEKLVENSKNVPVLILDDIGGKEVASERVLQALYLIINHRYLNRLITICNSNKRHDHLDEIPRKNEGNQIQAISERVENTYFKIHIPSDPLKGKLIPY